MSLEQLKELSIDQLKSLAYDQMVIYNNAELNLRTLNQLISERSQPVESIPMEKSADDIKQ